jgi:chemotaxis protein histidine kinase CheA
MIFRKAGLGALAISLALLLSACVEVKGDVSVNSAARFNGELIYTLDKSFAAAAGITTLADMDSESNNSEELGFCKGAPFIEDSTNYILKCPLKDAASETGEISASLSGNNVVFRYKANLDATSDQTNFGSIALTVRFLDPVVSVKENKVGLVKRVDDLTYQISGYATEPIDIEITANCSSRCGTTNPEPAPAPTKTINPVEAADAAIDTANKAVAAADAKALTDLKAKEEADAKAAAEKEAADLKAKQEADAKAAAELKAKQAAETKAAAEKTAAELKAKQDAEAKAAAELKAKQEGDAKAAAEKAAADLKAKQDTEAKAAAEKAAADLKAKQDAEAKAAADKAAAAKAAAAKILAASKAAAAAKAKAAAKKTTITCVMGKLIKKVTAVKPVCPKGYKKK